MRSADEFDSRRQLWQNPIFTARRRTAVPLSERGDAIALGLRNARFLKTWLGDNLPGFVERLVSAEIERVARGE
jgi:hypothetical protein